MFRLTTLAAATMSLAACVSVPSQGTLDAVRAQQNPTDRATRTITNFTPALRCMDELMFRLGTRDVTLMMEELRDATQKVPVSARDMMTSAISDMSRRSRAVRLSVFGSDQQNLTQLLQQLQKTSAFEALPEYSLRGTISQLDEDIKRDSSALGLLTQKALGVRLGSETRFSVLGFDSALVRTANLQLVPGVASKNTTIIVKRDHSAGDGQATLLGANAVFSFSAARSEGAPQAARNMVELAAIELVGKLTRAPYWQCLGLPDQHPEVLRETEDWFVAMDPDERVAFVKERLRDRRYFDGGIDGTETAAYAEALARYRAATGLPPSGPLDLAFFRGLITLAAPVGPLAPLPRKAPGVVAAPAGTAASAAQAAVGALPNPGSGSGSGSGLGSGSGSGSGNTADPTPPLSLAVEPVSGQRLQVRLAVGRPGYVYCYAQDPQSRSIRRIFPNRFQRDPRLDAGGTLRLPGTAGFSIGAQQAVACIHAPREVYADLPPPLRWGDFEPVKLARFEDIRLQFAEASGQNVSLVLANPPAL